MKFNIVIFGDSITYGAGDNEKGGWVNRLRLSLENISSEDEYNVFNMGIDGNVTQEVKERFASDLKPRIIKDFKTVIVFAIGINDAQTFADKDRVSIKEFTDNIAWLIQEARKYTDDVMFIGLSRVDETKVKPLRFDTSKSYDNAKISAYDKKLKNLCLNNGVFYLSMFDLLDDADLLDGIHPNSQGHKKYALRVEEAIISFVKD